MATTRMTSAPHRTVSDVLQDIVGNIQGLVRSEFRLAQAEIKEKAQRATRPAAMVGAGAVVGMYGFGFLLLAVVYALSLVVAVWLAALLVGAVLAILGAILLSVGRKGLQNIDPLPERTVETVKEGVQWTKEQIK
jgi:uncharacterized membrane protein YqjE